VLQHLSPVASTCTRSCMLQCQVAQLKCHVTPTAVRQRLQGTLHATQLHNTMLLQQQSPHAMPHMSTQLNPLPAPHIICFELACMGCCQGMCLQGSNAALPAMQPSSLVCGQITQGVEHPTPHRACLCSWLLCHRLWSCRFKRVMSCQVTCVQVSTGPTWLQHPPPPVRLQPACGRPRPRFISEEASQIPYNMRKPTMRTACQCIKYRRHDPRCESTLQLPPCLGSSLLKGMVLDETTCRRGGTGCC
jgi:hypothetical protein